MVLFIGFLILLIRTANLNKRYREFMLKLGKGKKYEEDLENYIYRVEKVEKQNSDLQLVCKEISNQMSGCIQK